MIAAAVAWWCRYVKRQTEVLAEKISVAEAMGAKVGVLRINPVIDRRIRRNSRLAVSGLPSGSVFFRS